MLLLSEDQIDTAVTFVPRLPNRLQQIAFSQWDAGTSDTDVDTLETGLGLNASSKCNASAASGLETEYTDTNLPTLGSLFSLPGTDESNIRSMYTGSTQTQSCASRYGVQDAVGNVAELLSDRFRCSGDPKDGSTFDKGLSQCGGVGTTIEADTSSPALPARPVYDFQRLSTSEDLYAVSADGTYGYYSMGKKVSGVHVGPCADNVDSDGECDGPLTSWAIEDTSFDAGQFFIPMGLPAHSLFPISNPTSVAGKSMSTIGLTSGITTSQLHNDKITVNSYIFASLSGNGTRRASEVAGRWLLAEDGMIIQVRECTTFNLFPVIAYGYYQWDELVFRRLTPNTAAPTILILTYVLCN